MNTKLELELAELALHGRRLEDAEERYTKLLEGDASGEAWLGLGLVKFGMVANSRSTPAEVVFCFKKLYALDPDRKGDASRLLLTAANGVLSEIVQIVPKVVAAEDAAYSAMVTGVLNKGWAYLRAESTSSEKRPSLFTNLDALHDSFTGSAQIASSLTVKADVKKVRAKLTTVNNGLKEIVGELITHDFAGKKEFLEACANVANILAKPIDELSATEVEKGLTISSENSALDTYRLSKYRSSDEKMLAGVCAGIGHKRGSEYLIVRCLFLMFVPISIVVYFVMWDRRKVCLPTKGIPPPQKPKRFRIF